MRHGRQGSNSFVGPEPDDRSDLPPVFTLGALSAQSGIATLLGIPSPSQKIAAF